jgi:hypothetical protein
MKRRRPFTGGEKQRSPTSELPTNVRLRQDRAGATRLVPASHASMASQPDVLTKLILTAAHAPGTTA